VSWGEALGAFCVDRWNPGGIMKRSGLTVTCPNF